jgi:hypothetical protein
MKTSIPFLFVGIALLSGCAVNTGEVDDADGISDVADSQEPVAEAAQASTLFGVNMIPDCFGSPGWPKSFSAWVEVYGSFDNNGNNVTANLTATFNNGDPAVALKYLYSNYRSSSQVNLYFSGSSYSSCPDRYSGQVQDGGVYLGSYSR